MSTPFACRLCGADATPLADRGDLALFRCGACGFVSGRPARDVATDERYAGYYHEDVLAAPAPEGRYDEWLARAERARGAGRLLEVGAGSGGFVEVARRRGWQVEATEVSRSGLQRLRATGARVFAGDVADAGYADGAFDFVVSLEVIEHVPAPARQLREIARVLRPGGLLLLSTPSFAGLSRRALGLRWRVIDPEHLGYFTPRTLRAALRAAGFTRAHVRSRGLDVSTWRPAAQGQAAARFDPQAAAGMRDRVNASSLLRAARDTANVALGLTGLGDSLLAWARR